MSDKTLAELNKRESKESILSRLYSDVVPRDSEERRQKLIDAMEFRRDQYGLSVPEYAAILGMGGGHYYEFLQGKRALSLRATKRAATIGVHKDSLLAICEYL